MLHKIAHVVAKIVQLYINPLDQSGYYMYHTF
jgi:hypothetical protein